MQSPALAARLQIALDVSPPLVRDTEDDSGSNHTDRAQAGHRYAHGEEDVAGRVAEKLLTLLERLDPLTLGSPDRAENRADTEHRTRSNQCVARTPTSILEVSEVFLKPSIA